MPLNPLNHHYAMENPASIFDEEALTALQLAGRTTHKVNEVVKAFNALELAVPGMVSDQVIEHVKNGEFDQAISVYLGDLESRVDNLLSSYTPGSTTGDAELLDMRIGPDGTKYSTAGEAMRHYLNLGGLVEDTNYQTKMPDANQVLTPSAYIMHFASGSSEIPANLPIEKWYGRIGCFITLPGTYYRQLFITDNAIFTRNASTRANWSKWRAIGKPTYIIDINGGGDFASILKALSTYNTNARFIIKKGVYDINLEYKNVYGSAYFENYTGYSNSQDVMDRGLFLGDGVELIGEGRVELVFSYTGSNENVKKYFSVLNTSQNNHIQNVDVTIEDGSCRYLIHDDFATDGGTNIFKNMTCTGHSFLGTAIGGGFGIFNTYVIEDCVFKNPQQGIAIAYHNNANDGKNKLIINGCDCEGSIYIKHYGESVQKSQAEVFNCRATKIVLTHGDIETYPNENIELATWNNNVNGSTDVNPEMFGAVGDGVTDDTPAIKKALETGKTVVMSKDYYIINNVLKMGNNHSLVIDNCKLHLIGVASMVHFNGSYSHIRGEGQSAIVAESGATAIRIGATSETVFTSNTLYNSITGINISRNSSGDVLDCAIHILNPQLTQNESAYYNYIDRVTIRYAKAGILLEGYANANIISNILGYDVGKDAKTNDGGLFVLKEINSKVPMENCISNVFMGDAVNSATINFCCNAFYNVFTNVSSEAGSGAYLVYVKNGATPHDNSIYGANNNGTAIPTAYTDENLFVNVCSGNIYNGRTSSKNVDVKSKLTVNGGQKLIARTIGKHTEGAKIPVFTLASAQLRAPLVVRIATIEQNSVNVGSLYKSNECTLSFLKKDANSATEMTILSGETGRLSYDSSTRTLSYTFGSNGTNTATQQLTVSVECFAYSDSTTALTIDTEIFSC